MVGEADDDLGAVLLAAAKQGVAASLLGLTGAGAEVEGDVPEDVGVGPHLALHLARVHGLDAGRAAAGGEPGPHLPNLEHLVETRIHFVGWWRRSEDLGELLLQLLQRVSFDLANLLRLRIFMNIRFSMVLTQIHKMNR